MTSIDETNPFDRVRARLHEKGWVKNSWGGPEGPNCVNGAADYALGSCYAFNFTQVVGDIATEQFPERVRAGGSALAVIDFNNHEDTTLADVDLILDKAARRLDEQGAQ